MSDYDPPLHSPEGRSILGRMDEIADRILEETPMHSAVTDPLQEYRSWLDDQDGAIERDGGWPTEWVLDSETVSEFIDFYNSGDG